MVINNQEFIEQVKQLYLRAPGQVANIAFHKLESFLLESETQQLGEGDKRCLFAVRNNQLIFYYSEQKQHFLLPTELLRYLDFLVLHEDYYRLVSDSLLGFVADENCTLFYDQKFQPPLLTDQRYLVNDFDFQRDADFITAAEIITGTKTGYTVTPERVRRWTSDKAFDPSLWLLARDRQSGKAVGVGISCYYAPVREADLDWFFVDPRLQGLGIGRMLIAETVSRCLPKSDIIRLAGIADGFYQKCGFQRGDKWFVVRKQK